MKTHNRTISTQCYPCLFQQILSIAKLTKLNDKQTKTLFENSMTYLLETQGEGIFVQHLVRKTSDTIIKMLDKPSDFDPYRELKKLSNDIALKHIPMFKDKVKVSKTPLQTALKIAAAGNIIDFGAKKHCELDIEKELSSIEQRGFEIYHFEQFEKSLSEAKSLLYLCDNSGEIVLDKIFIEEIKRTFPSLNITCAVRHKAIINDALLEDATYIGLDKIMQVVSSGSVYPGTILDETSTEFKQLFNKADIIISKGQGNLETLLEVANEKIFFILRIKCEMIAKLLNAHQGNLVLAQGK